MATHDKTATNKMKGGVRQRGKGGAWSFTLYLGTPEAQRCVDCDHRAWVGTRRLERCPKCGGDLRDTNESRQFNEGGYPTRKAAELARATMFAEYHGQGAAPKVMSSTTFAEFLRDVWLPAIRAGKLKLTTKESYARSVERHMIGPAAKPLPLGLTLLHKLTTKQIRAHYVKLGEGFVVDGVLRSKSGRPLRDKDTGEVKRGLVKCKGLGAGSQRRVHAALHLALAMAVEDGYLKYNPASGLGKGIGDGDAVPRELPAWSEVELLAFLTSQRHTADWALWHVMAYTGMRRGEALGLQRGDIDLDGAKITVRRSRVPVTGEGRGKPGRVIISSPKTGKPRDIELDAETVEVLRSVLWGSVSPADLDQTASAARWVFCDAVGEPLGPNSVSARFRKVVIASGQRAIPLHGLRHTHATILLSAGVPVTTVSVRLGHANPMMTMNVYSHCLPRAQQAAVAVLANMGAGRAT